MNLTSSEPLLGLSSVAVADLPTPLSNRGVGDTKSIISLDWLTFTAPVAELGRFLELLGMGEEWVPLKAGRWGYPEAIMRGTTTILSGVRDEICVVCSGVTCCELRERGMADEELIGLALSVGKNITRLDVAFDTMGSALSLSRVKQHCEDGLMTSRFRKWSEISPRQFGSTRREGWTLNMGSRQSASFVRFYDKGLETGAYPANVWTRCEIEYKKENAAAAARLLHEGGMQLAAGLLANLIDFKEVDQTDSNKSRQVRAAWWADFLASAEKIRLLLPSPKPTLARAVAWVKNQVAPTLAAIVEATGGDLAIVHEVLTEGIRRQRARHRLIVSSGMMLGAT